MYYIPFYSTKIGIVLSVTIALLSKGAVTSVTRTSEMISKQNQMKEAIAAVDNAKDTPEVTAPIETGDPTGEAKEGKNVKIRTDSVEEMIVPTPEPTPTPTPTPVPKKETYSGASGNSGNTNSNTQSNSASANNSSSSGGSQSVSSSGTRMFYFDSYGGDSEAAYNACVAEANAHAVASCNVTADDSGYLLEYSG